MKCKKCGYENEKEAKYCYSCGSSLHGETGIKYKTKEERDSEECMAYGIAGLVLAFLLSFISIPFNIVAMTKGRKIKKETGNTPLGYKYGLYGLIIGIVFFIVKIATICLIFGAFFGFIRETRDKGIEKINEIRENQETRPDIDYDFMMTDD